MISTLPSILATPGMVWASSEPNLRVSDTFLKVIELIGARMTVNWIELIRFPILLGFPNLFS